MSELGIFYPEKGYKKTEETFEGTISTIINSENFEEMYAKISESQEAKLDFKITYAQANVKISLNLKTIVDTSREIVGGITLPFIFGTLGIAFYSYVEDDSFVGLVGVLTRGEQDVWEANVMNIPSIIPCTLKIISYE